MTVPPRRLVALAVGGTALATGLAGPGAPLLVRPAAHADTPTHAPPADAAAPHFVVPPYTVPSGQQPGLADLGLERGGPDRRIHRRLPPAATVASARTLPTDLTVSAGAIPRRVLQAYLAAAQAERGRAPGCGLRWQLLAGIGYVESGHAHSGGSAAPGWNGEARPPIYGPELNGRAFVAWPDTDGGRLDGDPRWDRAVGPMQFMPATWQVWGADGNGDGVRDPQQIDDATLAAADYLCAAGTDLAVPAGMRRAVFAYNHSAAYVRVVLTVAAGYAGVDPSAFGVTPPKPGRHDRHRHGHGSPTGGRHRHRSAPAAPKGSAGATTSPAPRRSGGPTPSAAPTMSPSGSPTASPSTSPTRSPSPSPSPSRVPTPTPSDTSATPSPSAPTSPGG